MNLCVHKIFSFLFVILITSFTFAQDTLRINEAVIKSKKLQLKKKGLYDGDFIEDYSIRGFTQDILFENELLDFWSTEDLNCIEAKTLNYSEENVLNIKWNKMNEINDLQKIDIGVYPLFKDEWVLGKSGLKALQYMALSIPTISTNYGNIKDIINNEQNGFLVNNSDEWLKILIKLCDDIDLRNFIGNNGRKVVEKYYSLKVISKKYQSVIKKL